MRVVFSREDAARFFVGQLCSTHMYLTVLTGSYKLNIMKNKDNDSRYETITHPLAPFYRSDSEILILGSFPSVKTREMGFFYGHPQNRFWPVLAALFGEELPLSIEERTAFLERNRVACWDVIYQCDIIGSSDSSIRNVTPTDLAAIIAHAPIRGIFCNGGTSAKLFKKYQEPLLGRSAVRLLSSSPANAAYSLEQIVEDWKVILTSDTV